MARKMMTKAVTSTTIKSVEVRDINGELKMIPLTDVIVMGNVDKRKAQIMVNKMYSVPVTVTSVESETVVYEMEVTRFMELATIKEEKTEE